jgi:hypothetical protein
MADDAPNTQRSRKRFAKKMRSVQQESRSINGLVSLLASRGDAILGDLGRKFGKVFPCPTLLGVAVHEN